MGVRGLTKYINENAKLYLKPYELCNTYLVVDGSCVACHIFNWLSKSDSVFGGDYDEYYDTVQTFFKMLLKSNVTPIVIWDGGIEKKKLKTVLSRARTKIDMLRDFNRGYSSAKFFPLLMRQTFCDVMEDLGIICIQSELEADIEIAAVAKALNCPVMSNDSDFFIYDVLYIPFSSVYKDPVKLEVSKNKFEYSVKCSVYDVNTFLESEGLDKSSLPIIAILLGNDYSETQLFDKFFCHVHVPKSKKASYSQRKIQGVLHWMKNESVESATEGILCHIEKKKADKVQKAINDSIKDYSNFTVSPFVAKKVNQLLSENGKDGDLLKENTSNTELPSIIKDLFQKCRIHTFVMDIITLGTYFSPMQVEDLNKKSTHSSSFDLIKAIFQLLKNYAKNKLDCVRIFLLSERQYHSTKLQYNSDDSLSVLNLEEILNDSKERRLNLLFKILNLSKEDEETVSNFCETWLVFILTLTCWIKALKDQISSAHVHAILLMSIVNQIVQKNVGYFRNNSTFMKKKAYFFDKLKDTDLSVVKGEQQDFSQLIDNVTQFECLQIQQIVIPFRHTTPSGMGKKFSISTIHLFNCFQSCLFHVMQLNALFNYPLPHLKISDFYSGTVLFNFYLLVSSKSDVSQFGKSLFKNTPNIENLYDYLVKVVLNSTKSVSNNDKRQKASKTNKKKKGGDKKSSDVEEFVLLKEVDNDNDEGYQDENNIYSYLLSV